MQRMKKSMKAFIAEQVAIEDEALLRAAENDPITQGACVSKEMDERLFARIREYEENKEATNEKELQERLRRSEEEIVHLKKMYRRSRKFGRFSAVAACLVLICAVSVTSLGGGAKIIDTLSKTLRGGETELKVKVDDGSVETGNISDESEAYAAMKEEWNVEIVRMDYLPQNIVFSNFVFKPALMYGRLLYQEETDLKIAYQIMQRYQVGTKTMIIDDVLLQQYETEVSGTSIIVQEYKTESGNRWMIQFEYKDMQYFIQVMDEKDDEIDKIIKNLIFS